VSRAALLELNRPEEALAINLERALVSCSLPSGISPISDYFRHTQALVNRFIRPELSTDGEALSLLVLGVVSAAEFYFRSIIVQSLDVCPYAMKQANKAEVSLGSLRYYGTQIKNLGFSIFEHKSLADASEIKKELQRLVGVTIKPDSSAATALNGFDTLCELRHAAIHARGYVGFKNASDLGASSTSVQRINFSLDTVFDLTKLSHNAVRSFNRHVLDGILSRWIADRYLTGNWRADRKKFSALFMIFAYPEENAFGSDVSAAYRSIQPAIRARMNNEPN
jgi:hypothetical protein